MITHSSELICKHLALPSLTHSCFGAHRQQHGVNVEQCDGIGNKWKQELVKCQFRESVYTNVLVKRLLPRHSLHSLAKEEKKWVSVLCYTNRSATKTYLWVASEHWQKVLQWQKCPEVSSASLHVCPSIAGGACDVTWFLGTCWIWQSAVGNLWKKVDLEKKHIEQGLCPLDGSVPQTWVGF